MELMITIRAENQSDYQTALKVLNQGLQEERFFATGLVAMNPQDIAEPLKPLQENTAPKVDQVEAPEDKAASGAVKTFRESLKKKEKEKADKAASVPEEKPAPDPAPAPAPSSSIEDLLGLDDEPDPVKPVTIEEVKTAIREAANDHGAKVRELFKKYGDEKSTKYGTFPGIMPENYPAFYAEVTALMKNA